MRYTFRKQAQTTASTRRATKRHIFLIFVPPHPFDEPVVRLLYTLLTMRSPHFLSNSSMPPTSAVSCATLLYRVALTASARSAPGNCFWRSALSHKRDSGWYSITPVLSRFPSTHILCITRHDCKVGDVATDTIFPLPGTANTLGLELPLGWLAKRGYNPPAQPATADKGRARVWGSTPACGGA